jgi:uncharacterized protein (TIGR00162 family)
MGNVHIHQHIDLKDPVLLAAWPGISNVGLEAATYLRNKLEATELAAVDPVEFFTPLGILVHNNVVQFPMFPENKFYLARTPEGKSDLVIFIGEAQPDHNQYDLAHTIIDVAKNFKVKRVYTCAAAIVQHIAERARVWAAVTDASLTKELQKYKIVLRGDFQIRGLNGLLLGAARERGMEGVCLLGETPHYAAEMSNPIASYAVLGVLTEMLGIEIDLSDIAKEAEQMAETMKALSQEVMDKYIGHFTEPLWERNPDEEDE